MEMISESSRLRDITRGGQLYMHSFRMFGQVLKITLMISLIIFASIFIGSASKKTTTYERYILGQYVEAQLKAMFNEHAYNVIENPKGTHPRIVQINSVRFLKMPVTLRYVERCMAGLIFSFKWALGISVITWLFILAFLGYKGNKQHVGKKLIGQGRVTAEGLKKLLKKKKKASEFSLADVPLVHNTEVQHILLAGTTGTGKSVCMQELMDQVRMKQHKAIVFDIDGAFVANYYRPEKDILLNPLDDRCPVWNIWQECRDKADYEAAAHSLMPIHLSGNDPFWIHASHTIFSVVAESLAYRNKKQNQQLIGALFTEQLESLSELVSGTPAESLVSEKNEKTALSIKATLSTYCKALTYLKEDSKGPLFSIRRWIEREDHDSWLFIATDAQKIEALRPLLSLWFDTAAKSVLSLPPFAYRRLWFFADELPKLQRLPNLKALLERGRKYGVCFIGAIQDLHQIYATYGRNDAETLTSLFNTKVFFRSQEPQSIAWMSKVMGGLELLEKKEGFSYGANDMRDGVSIHEERRREPAIKGSEFTELEDLQAFLKLPGAWPVAKIEFKVKDRIYTQPYFIPIKPPNLSNLTQNAFTAKEEKSRLLGINTKTIELKYFEESEHKDEQEEKKAKGKPNKKQAKMIKQLDKESEQNR